MENPEPRAQYLNVVLRQIDRTSLRIPRFQRHFVWDQQDVIELLESIKRGYPIGSILTWRVESNDDYFSGFRVNPFPDADDALGTFEVILDGAQRLSSLYGCLRNPGASEVYNVSYDARLDEFVHASDIRGNEPWHVPMSSLFDSRKFLQVQSDVSSLDDAEELLPRALDLYATFQDYQVPIIALSNAVLEDVVEVFRRVNSSGTPLSSVDFVRAITWKSNFDLEENFDSFVDEFQSTPLEGLNDEFLIRCLAIAAGLTLDARDVLQLKTLSVRPEGLDAELLAMGLALRKMVDFLATLDVANLTEVPYEAQKLILFALMHYGAPVEGAQLEAWLWRSTFAEEHQSKPESYLTRLVREIRAGNSHFALEVRKPVEADLFATRARRAGSAVTTGFDLLLRKSQARSLISGNPVESSTALYAHLFNKAELTDGLGEGGVSTMLLANFVLLSEDDNLVWRSERGANRLQQMFDSCQDRTGDAERIWESQGLKVPLGATPLEVFRERSEMLLARVVDL